METTPELNSSGDSILELRDVTIKYDTAGAELLAVEGVSFNVTRGERYVIMGRSGCGKSTLLKAIGGFIKPTSGKILLNSQEITSPGPNRMVVWQDLDQLLPWKTIEENVAFPLVMNGIDKREAIEASQEWLDRVGLSKATKYYPHQLSGGMKQRAAIARGFVANPEVLLMDEPYSALDALTRYRLQEELISLQEKFAVTVVFVTHDVNEAARLGTHVLVLTQSPGRVKHEFLADTPNLKKIILESIFDDGGKKTKPRRKDHE